VTRPETLEERVARLEDVAFEGDGLTRAVTRLGLNANALGEALLTVDRNQQQLTKLGGELQQVQASAATKDEVHEKAATVAAVEREARRTLAVVIGTAIAALVAILAYTQFTTKEYRQNTYNVCQARSAQSAKVNAFLDAALKQQQTRPDLTPEQRAASKQQTELLRQAFPLISCETLKP
jgi:hypothetical protein